jgi:hypothetical protein
MVLAVTASHKGPSVEKGSENSSSLSRLDLGRRAWLRFLFLDYSHRHTGHAADYLRL